MDISNATTGRRLRKRLAKAAQSAAANPVITKAEQSRLTAAPRPSRASRPRPAPTERNFEAITINTKRGSGSTSPAARNTQQQQATTSSAVPQPRGPAQPTVLVIQYDASAPPPDVHEIVKQSGLQSIPSLRILMRPEYPKSPSVASSEGGQSAISGVPDDTDSLETPTDTHFGDIHIESFKSSDFNSDAVQSSARRRRTVDYEPEAFFLSEFAGAMLNDPLRVSSDELITRALGADELKVNGYTMGWM